MQNILEELFDLPIEGNKMYYEPDSDFAALAHVKSDNWDKLMEQLTVSQKVLLEAYSAANSDLMEIRCFNKYTYGFHLGSSLMKEIMEL